MKKNAISIAVAAAVASSAATAQLYLNPEKTGDALIFPFYDAENGNATNFHIVNTTDRVKAAKIRFREYKASEEVLDFNIYLSPTDHFAFGVIMDPNGTGGAIITSDNTCTVPALGQPNGGFDGTTTENADGSITRIQPFTTFLFQTNKWVDSSPERTLRGYVEVLEMGEVDDYAAHVGAAQGAGAYASFATHGADGVPANCAGLVDAWLDNNGWAGNPNRGLSAPTGGLYGLAYHINVEDAAAWGFEPMTLQDTWTGIEHASPGDEEPNFGAADTASYVPVDGVTDLFFWETGIDSVSSTIMAHQVMNDVQKNPVVGGQTDWVTTFPNKQAYVNIGAAINPFTDPYVGVVYSAAAGAYVELRACEPVSVSPYDREEAFVPDDVIFSPPPPGAVGNVICDEQTVVSWGTGATSALNVERDLSNLAFAYNEGWARWTFDSVDNAGWLDQALCENRTFPNLPADGRCLMGLPTIGFGAFKYANGSMGNTLMNYGHAADHKTNAVCSAASSSSVPQSGLGLCFTGP